jgi:micrococcal nuclease
MNDSTKSFIIAVVAFCFLLVILYFTIILLQTEAEENEEVQTFLVVNVTDGDTFEIATGEKVRLICVNSPESGEEGYVKSKNFLENLILGEEVILEQDENATPTEGYDKYNRLLRYAYIDYKNGTRIFINKELVKNGYAVVYPYGNNTSKCEETKG